MWLWKDRTEIDDLEWDSYLNKSHHPFTEFFSWYLDICCEHWGAYFHSSGARIPIPYSKSIIGIKKVTRPPYIQRLKVISNNEVDSMWIDYLFRELNSKFSCGTLDWIYKNSPECKKRNNYIIRDGYLELNQSQQRNYNRSVKQNLCYRISDQSNELFNWINQNGEKYSYEKDFNNNLFKSLVNKLIKNNYAFIIFAETDNGEIQAASIFVKSVDRLLFLLSFNSSSGKKSGAIVGIIMHIIHNHLKRNQILDLEGSDIPGVALFYESFGAINEPYYEMEWNNSFICKLISSLRKILLK